MYTDAIMNGDALGMGRVRMTWWLVFAMVLSATGGAASSWLAVRHGYQSIYAVIATAAVTIVLAIGFQVFAARPVRSMARSLLLSVDERSAHGVLNDSLGFEPAARDRISPSEIQTLDRAVAHQTELMGAIAAYAPKRLLTHVIFSAGKDGLGNGRISIDESKGQARAASARKVISMCHVHIADVGKESDTALLNDVLAAFVSIVEAAYAGFVVSASASHLFAVWNAVDTVYDHRGKALEAALACVAAVRSINAGSNGTLEVTAGVHSGTPSVGTVGAAFRLFFSVSGPDARIPERLATTSGYAVSCSGVVQANVGEFDLHRSVCRFSFLPSKCGSVWGVAYQACDSRSDFHAVDP